MPASAPIQPQARLAGEVGPYRILGVLGEGGMGVVYRAEDKQTGRHVALKTVRGVQSNELRGIRSEILTLSRLNHPMVVRLLGQGMHEGVPWYAMELLEGKTLAAYSAELWKVDRATADEETSTLESMPSASNAAEASVLETGAMAPVLRLHAAGGKLAEVLRLFRLLCEPLAFLHGLGLVHRDLKPSNVFLCDDGTVKLMDFGTIARFLGSSNREALEVGGLVVGSAAYMAPEQIRGDVGDARADLYALGCMIYEVVAGQRPFMADTVTQMFKQHLSSEALPLSQRVVGVPAELDGLVRGLMEKQSRHRMGYVDDVAAVLESLGAPRPERVNGPYRSYLYRPEMAGRRELLAQLVDRTAQARDKQGAMVLLGGESGVGKTFLASRVALEAAHHHMRVVAAECVPIAVTQGGAEASGEVRGAPLHLFRTLLQAIGDHGRQRGLAWTEAVLGPRGKVLAPYEPSFRELPGQAAHPEPPELAADAAHRRLIEDFASVLLAFVEREGALLLVLDDLQWADELSLDFLGALVGKLPGHALLVLGTYRSDEVGPRLRELLDTPGVAREKVDRLDEQALGSVVSDMLSLPQPPEDFVHFLARQSEGNPFFVAEYLRTAVAERLLMREAGRWRFANQDMAQLRYEALPLPDSVRELVVRRLSGLEPTARALVEMASVLGREGSGSLLRLAARIPEDEALGLLKELGARQILEPFGVEGYRFVHDKLREHAYQSIAPERRQALHHTAALTLENASAGSMDLLRQYGALAHHFQQAGVWSKAVDYTEKAGEQAQARFSSRDAITHFERAFELAARLPDELPALRKVAWERSLVDAHLALGHFDEGRQHAERALRYCGLTWPTSEGGWKRGLLKQVLECALPLPRSLLAPSTPEERTLMNEAAYIYNRMLEPMFILNRAIQGFYCGFRSLNLAERLEPSAALARSLAFMPQLLGSAPPLKKVATRWSYRSVEIADALGQGHTLVYALVRSSTFHISHAEWAEAERRLQRAERIAQQLGDARQLEEVMVCYQNTYSYQGYFEQAIAAGQRGLESGKKRGDRQILNWLQGSFGLSLSRLGRAAEGVEEMEAGLKRMQSSAGDADLMWTYGSLALAHLEAQQFEKARQHADTMMTLVRKERLVHYFLVYPLAATAETYLALWESGREGGSVHAKTVAEACEALKLLTKLYPYGQPALFNLNGDHARLLGNTARALESWKAALARAEQLAIPYEEGRAHWKLGQHLRGAEGRNHLERAAALFERLSARPDLERVRQALARAG